MPELNRRVFLLSTVNLLAITACAAPQVSDELTDEIKRLEGEHNAQIGLAIDNLATGAVFRHRGDQRFAMCSSFKWLLGAIILEKVKNGELELYQQIGFSEDDLVTYSPIVEPALASGSLTLAELCEGTIQLSDNTAANLLLRQIGGPSALTEWIRAQGDPITRLDRYEPDLNKIVKGDERDTTTPDAMNYLLERLLFQAPKTAEKTLLQNWMLGTTTGKNRLPAGTSENWQIGHKTGTGLDGQSNDVGFMLSSNANEGPVIISVYIRTAKPMAPETDGLHKRMAEISFTL